MKYPSDRKILCPSCRSFLNVEDKFCSSCGHKLANKNRFIKSFVLSGPFVAGGGIIGGLIGFFIGLQVIFSDTSGAAGFFFLFIIPGFAGIGFMLGSAVGSIFAIPSTLANQSYKSGLDYVKIVASGLLLPAIILVSVMTCGL